MCMHVFHVCRVHEQLAKMLSMFCVLDLTYLGVLKALMMNTPKVTVSTLTCDISNGHDW